MIKAQIKKQNIVTNAANFETQAEAEAWVLKESQNGSFGKLDRWLSESKFNGESIAQAVATRLVEQLGQDPVTEYNFAQEFEVVYTDITIELLAKKESDIALQYLKDTDWYVVRKVDSGLVIPQTIIDLRAAARLKVLP